MMPNQWGGEQPVNAPGGEQHRNSHRPKQSGKGGAPALIWAQLVPKELCSGGCGPVAWFQWHAVLEVKGSGCLAIYIRTPVRD